MELVRNTTFKRDPKIGNMSPSLNKKSSLFWPFRGSDNASRSAIVVRAARDGEPGNGYLGSAVL